MVTRLALRDRSRGWLYAAAGMLVVSTDSFFVRWSRADAWDVVFVVSLVSIVTYLLLGSQRESLNPISLWHRFPIALPAVAVLAAVSQVSYVTAVTRTSVANVVVIVAASPVMVALLGRIFFGEKTSRRVWIAIAVTFVGMTVTVAGSVGEPNLNGDLLAVLAVVAFSVGVNIWRRCPDMSRFVGLLLAAAVVVIVSAFFASPFSLDARAYLACLGMGLLNPLGRLLHTNAPRYAPAAEVALFTPVETVAASLWAWLAFAEVPKLGTVIGALIIVGAVLYGTVTARERLVR